MAVFVNKEIEQIVNDTSKYCESLKKALYEQFKVATCMTKSNNFRGGSADSYKQYIQDVSIYFIIIFLNVADEVSSTIQSINTIIRYYESDDKGIIGQDTVQAVSNKLNDKKRNFDLLMNDIQQINAKAAEFISLTRMSYDSVNNDFDTTKKNLEKVQNDFVDSDGRAFQQADKLMSRISELSTGISKIYNDYHNSNHRIDYNKVAQISKQAWYKPEPNTTLLKMWLVDPFIYEAGQGAVWEDQWAAGFSPEIYATVGASFLSGQYDVKYQDNVFTANAKGAVASGNVNAQLTDWVKFSANGYVLGGSGSFKAGWSDKYKGIKAEAEAAAAKASGSFKVGNENFNGFIKGDAEVLGANGYAVAEYQDKNDFDVGLGGKASLADASASAGFSFFGAKVNKTGEKTNLLGLNVGVKADAGVSAGARVTSKNVYDGSVVDVNVVSIKVDLSALVGASVDVSVPEVTFGW